MSKDYQKKSYYDILKIPHDANDREVRDAYLSMARIYHPDNNPDKKNIALSRFKMIKEAYEVLKTEDYRKIYNRDLYKKAGNDNNNPSIEPTIWKKLLGLSMPTMSKFSSNKPLSNKK